MHCKIIGYTNIKDSDQTAHLRISDVNISIKDPVGGSWLRGEGWWRWGTLKHCMLVAYITDVTTEKLTKMNSKSLPRCFNRLT